MPAMTEAAQIGKRQELEDAIYNIEADLTPVLSRLPVGKAPNQMLSQWVAERYPDVPSTSIVDGTPANNPQKVDRKLLQGYGHFTRREWAVTSLATLTNVAGAGRDEAGHQAMLAMLLAKRMIEQQICSNDDTAVSTGVTGFVSRGAFQWLSPTAQAILPVDPTLLPAAATQYTGAIASFTEELLNGMLLAMFQAKRAAVKLDVFAGLTLRQIIDDFTNVFPTASSTSQPRTIYRVEGNDTFQRMVDAYKCSFGTLNIGTTTFNRVDTSTGSATAYTTGSGLFLDLAMWDIAYLQRPANTTLPPDGSGKRGFIDAVWVLRCKNPLGQGAVNTNN